jgi:antitoxin PrlF
MPTSTLTSKGQITLPKEIREYLHAKPGTQIDFIIQENGEIVMKAVNRSVRDLKRILAPYVKLDRPVTIEEMNDAIARGAAGLP